MPPKIPLMPTARTMATRPSNKNARPGLVDLSPSKRERNPKRNNTPTSQNDPALREKQLEQQTQALQRAAEIEDRSRREDDAFNRHLHIPAPGKAKSEQILNICAIKLKFSYQRCKLLTNPIVLWMTKVSWRVPARVRVLIALLMNIAALPLRVKNSRPVLKKKQAAESDFL